MFPFHRRMDSVVSLAEAIQVQCISFGQLSCALYITHEHCQKSTVPVFTESSCTMLFYALPSSTPLPNSQSYRHEIQGRPSFHSSSREASAYHSCTQPQSLFFPLSIGCSPSPIDSNRMPRKNVPVIDAIIQPTTLI